MQGKHSLTDEKHAAFINKKGMTEEEHRRWHEEHDNDPDFWAKKLGKKK